MAEDLVSRNAFHEAIRELGGADPTAIYDQLISAYAESSRAYHTLQHLEECLELLLLCPLNAEQRRLLELALCFHDAVYDAQAKDNEEQSAAWAEKPLSRLGLTVEAIAIICRLILVTKTHQAENELEAWMVDIDLAILGATPERYRQYELQIRQEYAWASDEVYATGRRALLQSFAGRDRLYQTAFFLKRFEERAGLNLAGSLGVELK